MVLGGVFQGRGGESCHQITKVLSDITKEIISFSRVFKHSRQHDNCMLEKNGQLKCLDILTFILFGAKY